MEKENSRKTPIKETERFLKIMKRVSSETQKMLEDFAGTGPARETREVRDMIGASRVFSEMVGRLMMRPDQLLDIQKNFWTKYWEIVHNTTLRSLGYDRSAVIAPASSDKRFRDSRWEENPFFSFIKQVYLLTSTIVQESVDKTEGMDPRSRQKADFYARQLIGAMAPSNYVATNPELLQATMETGGDNLIRGMKNLLDDIERSPCQLQIRLTDLEAFEVGKDLAVSPGKVIFENDMIQLIQYAPSTEEVHRRPIVFVPPWINKYYILDLTPENSMVKWMVDNGYTVFMISWVNPDARHAEKSFENYMLEGSVAAIDVALAVTGADKVNTIGYCMGGTLLSCTVAYLAAKERNVVASATYMATLMDFSRPGDMGFFIDEEQIAAMEESMRETGFLRGCEMANTFNMLRPNELIWAYVINNYLKGSSPMAFDLLFWNADSTNLPAAMHSFYLRNMYLHNRLREPGGVVLDGVPIDLTLPRVPTYFISTVDDHIALWEATYAGARLQSGTVRFVLGGSGHVAGIVNPPTKIRHGYKINTNLPETPQEWLKEAREHDGSWWPDWLKWNRKYVGKPVPARDPSTNAAYPPREDAPGCFVTHRLDDPDSGVCFASF